MLCGTVLMLKINTGGAVFIVLGDKMDHMLVEITAPRNLDKTS